MRTYIFKIKPKRWINEKFVQWVGVCRFLYNCAKERKEWAYKGGIKLSNNDLQKELTECKKSIDFLGDVHSQTLQAVMDKLDNTFKAFFKGAGYPKWAKKKSWNNIPFKSIKENIDGS